MGKNECLPDAETLRQMGRYDVRQNTGKANVSWKVIWQTGFEERSEK